MTYENGGNNPEFDSVRTGSLTDTDDDQAWETLRGAGFETGDFVPIGPTLGPQKDQDGSTSASSYDFLKTVINADVPLGTLEPTNGSLAFMLVGSLQGAGTTGSAAQLYNITDNEQIVSVTGVTTDKVVTAGPTDYSPSTKTPVNIRVAVRSDGTNTANLFFPTAFVGVQL